VLHANLTSPSMVHTQTLVAKLSYQNRISVKAWQFPGEIYVGASKTMKSWVVVYS